SVLIARKLALPYPVVLVLVGLALSFIPRLPEVQLNPNIVFYFFLPALLYPAALFTSWRDFRRSLRPILLLAIGLVLFTTAIIAWTAHSLIPTLPWPAAFALGAIISPTDATAATSIIRRLSVPHRVEVILEGESLVNDATALVMLQFAVTGLMTGSFLLAGASIRFFVVALGGIALGLLVGLIMRWVQRQLDDPPVQITISLLTPFAAYLPAERLHFSGILAVVTAGIFLGWHSPLIVKARYRLQAFGFWEMVVFLINGFIFTTIGLQLPGILRGLPGESLPRLIWEAALISAVAVLVRIAWVFPATYLPRLLIKRVRKRDPYPGWGDVAIVAWTGMRGVISLAAAFALPLTLPNGAAFPGRNHILFFTFCVILVTLVLQTLTLPLLIRKVGVTKDAGPDEEERSARLEANRAAMQLLEQLSNDGKFSADAIERLRAEYTERVEQLELCAANPDECRGEIATPHYQRLQQRALDVERKTIIQLRNQHVINDDALRRIQRDLDLAETRLAGR
ncbi:MAG: Na+/H+ antiporter, partial [Chthoniobacterales bacterium]